MFLFNTDKTPLEVVAVPTIFMGDPFLSLKRKKMGPIIDLKEERRERALPQVAKVEEGMRRRRELPSLGRKGGQTPLERGAVQPRLYPIPKNTKVRGFNMNTCVLSFKLIECSH